MTRTAYHNEQPANTGWTVYAKPLPLTTGTWGADVAAFTENGSTASYSGTITDTAQVVFRNLDGTPGNEAASDTRLGTIDVATPFAGSGANTVNVTLSDDSANLVTGSVVNVQTSAGVMLGIYGTTNDSGVVTFYLATGSYKMVVSDRNGYDTHTPEAVTVDESPEAVALTVTAAAGTPTSVGWIG